MRVYEEEEEEKKVSDWCGNVVKEKGRRGDGCDAFPLEGNRNGRLRNNMMKAFVFVLLCPTM